jgi:geranylgeranylglycerol-phosphate geranylgeranyltransferase
MAAAHVEALPLRVRLPAWAQLLRPGNCAMTALAVVVGAYVEAGSGAWARPVALLLAALAGFAFAGAGNALNDYVDRDTDRAAHPERPLPSGRALPGEARTLQGLLFAAALLCAFALGRDVLTLVGASLLLMVLYEYHLKAQGLPGNLAIAMLTAAPFVVGALTAGSLGAQTAVLAGLALCATLAREIVKDVEDMGGDLGRRTLPMRIGASRARRVAQGAVLLGVALSPLPWLVAPRLGVAGLPLLGLADGALLAAAWTRDPHRAQQRMKLAMLLALLAFAAGRLTA